MKKPSFGVRRAFAAFSLCLVYGLSHAQDDRFADTDPPERAARLSLIQGDVSLQPAGEEEWNGAILNRPLTTGDKLWVDQGARAEIHLGSAAIRLGSGTGFSFLNLDDKMIQMRITAGVINVSVRGLNGGDQIEIDTPNVALSVLRPGNYRVEVSDTGDTSVVKVSEGELEASGGELNLIVHAQQVATFRGTERLDAQFASLGSPDDFDSWSLERDRRDDEAANSRTAEYVSPDVTGYEDLDRNGTWSSEAEYGYVWTPRAVAVDWSPYRYGRWAWVGPWGWTWIDDAPWGYAPFHYGRWAHVRNRWCWVPGPRHVRAVYAPALVGWTGRGNGVGWFPLGPRDVYVPSRRFSHRYFERVNMSNTVIVNRSHLRNVYENRERNQRYRNREVKGAVTAVLRDRFTSGQRVGGHRISVDERDAGHATARAPQIEPVRESRLGARDTRRNVRVPPQSVVSRQVVVKRDPPPSGARFTRNAANGAQSDSRREQVDSTNRPRYRASGNGSDANARADAIRNAAQAAEARRVDGVRSSPNVQSGRDSRTPQVRQRNDRPPRDYQPRAESPARQAQPQPDGRPIADRPQENHAQQREHMERQQRGRQLQERREAEVQVREQREQPQQNHERAMRQQVRGAVREHQQNAERQRAAPQQTQQREHSEPQRPAENRPQPQRENNGDRGRRSEPQRPAENRPQPQRENNGDRGRSQRREPR